MRILREPPPELANRGTFDCVPLQCDCGVALLWERKRGSAVTCPACGRTEAVAGVTGPIKPETSG